MQFQVISKSKTRQALIDGMVRVLIHELKLTRSRSFLTVRSEAGLVKKDQMRGVVGPDSTNPAHIIMLLDSALSHEYLVETLCHEMVHVKQFALGQAKIKYRGEKATFHWLGKRVKAAYWDQPWEQDAWRRERVLASKIYKIFDTR
jgi:hypothetical protein